MVWLVTYFITILRVILKFMKLDKYNADLLFVFSGILKWEYYDRVMQTSNANLPHELDAPYYHVYEVFTSQQNILASQSTS